MAKTIGGNPRVGSRFWLFAMVLVLIGCGPNAEVEERKQYWEGEANAFFQKDRVMNEIHPWLREHNLIYTFEDSDIVDGSWTAGLERLFIETIRCEWVDIRLHVTVDDSRRIQSYFVEDVAGCLW